MSIRRMTADVDESSWNFNHKENDGNANPLVFQRDYHAALVVCKSWYVAPRSIGIPATDAAHLSKNY